MDAKTVGAVAASRVGYTRDDWSRSRPTVTRCCGRSQRPSGRCRTRLTAGQRIGRAAPRIDRELLRLRRRDAPRPGGDVSGRRTVHPVLRRVEPGWRSSCTTSSSKASVTSAIEVSLRPMAGHPPSGTVTFLLTDLEGSTRMWEQDPGAMKAAMVRHDEILEKTIAAHRGYVFARMGDGMAAAFATARDAVSCGGGVSTSARGGALAHRTPAAGPGRAAHRRGGDRRRHRLRQPADQSVLPLDDRRPWRADRRLRRHRDAPARTSCPTEWSSSTSVSTGCVTLAVPPGSSS